MMAQLILDLDDPRVYVPWSGVSPRDLTKGAKRLFLRRKPQKDDRNFLDLRQGDLFRKAEKAPRIYRGAPSLFPLE